MASISPARVGLFLGSNRPHGNGVGLAAWVQQRFRTVAEQLPSKHALRADGAVPEVVLLTPAGGPLGPVVDDSTLPAALDKHAPRYSSPTIQAWSDMVRPCAAYIFLSPQFNWGIPGELKNSLDHLYVEFHGKPACLLTYGGHGGSKCAEQLRVVCGGGLKMNVLADSSDVRIQLPRDNIAGPQRVEATGTAPAFAKHYEAALDQTLRMLLDAIANPPPRTEEEQGHKADSKQ